MAPCTKCGMNVTAKFCTGCGSPAPTITAQCSGCGAGMAAGQKFCTKCGKPPKAAGQACSCGAVLPPGAKFCTACGKPAASGCSKCGAALQPGAKFCTSCGTPVHACSVGVRACSCISKCRGVGGCMGARTRMDSGVASRELSSLLLLPRPVADCAPHFPGGSSRRRPGSVVQKLQRSPGPSDCQVLHQVRSITRRTQCRAPCALCSPLDPELCRGRRCRRVGLCCCCHGRRLERHCWRVERGGGRPTAANESRRLPCATSLQRRRSCCATAARLWCYERKRGCAAARLRGKRRASPAFLRWRERA